jgi:Thermolysin metallopeptidase, catalytic domain/Bacterial TSP3 repeat
VSNAGEPTRPYSFVDAHSGELIIRWEGLTNGWARGPGGNEKTGRYVYGEDFPTLDVEQIGSTCSMINENVKTVNMNHEVEGGAIHTFSCPENSGIEVNGAYSPLNDAHYFGGVVFDMYKDWLGFSPLPFQLIGMDNEWESYYGLDPADPTDAQQDADDDGLDNLQEFNVGSDPNKSDSDNDGLSDASEVNTHNTNPANDDSDNDSLSDLAEIQTHGTNPNLADSDDDGLSDSEEINNHGTHPNQSDSDGDGLGDGFESHYGFNPLVDSGEANQDNDSDSLSNQQEFLLGTHPLVADTDDDGLSDGHELNVTKTDLLSKDSDGDLMLDGWEVNNGLNPLNSSDGSTDPDSDNLINAWESVKLTDPNNPDSDGDSLSDGDEVHNYFTDPLSVDTDADGLTDDIELNTHRTDPTKSDTDDDGLEDGLELNRYSSDPLNPDTDSDIMTDGWEVEYGLDLRYRYDHVGDLDGDGWTNLQEFRHHTDPTESGSKPPAPGGTALTVLPADSGVYTNNPPYHNPSNTQFSAGHFTYWFFFKSRNFMAFNIPSGIYSQATLKITPTELMYVSPDPSEVFSLTSVEIDPEALFDASAGYAAFEELGSGEVYAEKTVTPEHGTTGVDIALNKKGMQVLNATAGEMFLLGGRVTTIEPTSTEDQVLFFLNDISTLSLELLRPNDIDGDGMTDEWEDQQGFDKNNPGDAVADDDGDALVNLQEFLNETNPFTSDSEADGLPDAWEIVYGLDPLADDSANDVDGDGRTNLQEYQAGTDPIVVD